MKPGTVLNWDQGGDAGGTPPLSLENLLKINVIIGGCQVITSSDSVGNLVEIFNSLGITNQKNCSYCPVDKIPTILHPL